MSQSTRLRSIDAIRGIAIIGMLQIHLWTRYFDPAAQVASLAQLNPVYLLGGYAAPLFTLISGLSAHLSVRFSHTAGAEGSERMAVRFLKRGAALFLLSTAINVVTGSVLGVLDIGALNWSIFQLIGFCLCVLPIYVRLPLAGKVVWIAAPLMLAEWVYPQTNLFHALFTGFAPLFPWGSLFFAGHLVGECLTKAQAHGGGTMHGRGRSYPRQMAFFVLTGILCFALGGLAWHELRLPFVQDHVALFNLTTATVYIGAFIVLTGAGHYLIDYRRVAPRVVARMVDGIAGLGRYSFTVYYLQLFAIVVSALVARRVLGHAPTLNPVLFVPALILTIVTLHLAINRLWARFNYRYTMEWLLAQMVRIDLSTLVVKRGPTPSTVDD